MNDDFFKNSKRQKQQSQKLHEVIETQDEIREMHDTMYHTNSWNDDFPPVYSHSLYYGDSVNGKKYSENVKTALLVGKAKRGNMEAAVELVNESINPDIIKELHAKYPNAIVCAVDGLEASGHNMIPLAYQEFLKAQGFNIDDKIEQSAKAHHTGADHLDKLLNRVRFYGEVQKDKEYILLDDHIALGGTLRDLKDYIESKGGKVVAFTTLTAPENDYRISLSKENLEKLNQYGEPLNELLREFGITDNIRGLTNGEASEIIELLSDSERDTTIEKGKRRIFSLRCKQIQEDYLIKHPEENPNKSNHIVSENDIEYNNTNSSFDVKEVSNNSLEQSSLDKASELLKGIQFTPENYKKLLNVINDITEMSGNEQLKVPTEEQVQKTAQEKDQKQKTEIQDVENEQKQNIDTFDPNAPVIYGKTILPAFTVMAEGKLHSIENAVIMKFDKVNQTYLIDNGSEKLELPSKTFETLLKDKQEQEEKIKRAEGRTIAFQDKERGIDGTIIPEFSMYTQRGLETFKDFVPIKHNPADDSYVISNGDSTMTVTAERFKEITAPERFENKFDENSPAWKKLCEQEYKDFFEPRDNCAYNFRHNLSVYCRKEANSPCDALHLAKDIISRMSKTEQKNTEKLLKSLQNKNETMNELIARIYHEAIQEQPLNEEYIKKYQPENVIARPMYDTISANGTKIENDPALIKGSVNRNLEIGSTLKNVSIETGSIFGKGKDTMHFDELKVISASKEGNTITVMDSNKSFFKLPRDTVLEMYKDQQLKEIKHEQRQTRSNTMSISYS